MEKHSALVYLSSIQQRLSSGANRIATRDQPVESWERAQQSHTGDGQGTDDSKQTNNLSLLYLMGLLKVSD
jgi:hypothetical protein